jgi:catechol 2,3-dioxygenase-like lactoylglutathione lyase family enzyme
MPLAHISLPVSNLETSLAFYLSALAPLGYKVFMKGDNYAGLAVRAPDFWLHCSPEGEKQADADSGREQACSPRTHVAFEGDSHSAVKKFYEAAL